MIGEKPGSLLLVQLSIKLSAHLWRGWGSIQKLFNNLLERQKSGVCFLGRQFLLYSDGAIGLKEALEDAFPQLQFILDRPHLKQHIYQGIEAMELPKKHFYPIFDATVSLIDVGKVRKIIKNFQNYKGTGAKEIETLANYLIRFQDCVHSRKFQSLGLPSGSGEVESAHKYIPQKRLKIPGATWHPDPINPMLALRIIRANDWWSEFWSKYKLPAHLNLVNNDLEPKLDLVS